MTADHPAPTPTPATVQAAQTALASAHAARAAARAARRVPAWHPPAAGLLYAAGFTGLAFLAHQDHPDVALMAASVTCLLGFLALFVVNARAGGVLLRPTGTPRERWLRQAPFLASTAIATTTAFLTNLPVALTVFGVTSGALVWLQLHRDRTRQTT